MRTVNVPLMMVGLGSACAPTYVAPDGADARQVQAACSPGTSCAPIEVPSLPATLRGDTRGGAESLVDRYACAPTTNESGNESWYAVDLPVRGEFTARLDEVAGDGIDVDVHLLTQLDADSCFARGHAAASGVGGPGTLYVVVDTWTSSGGASASGPYTLWLDFEPESSAPPSPAPSAIWIPGPGTTWQWQLTGSIDRSVEVDVYDVDLFDVPASTLTTLHDDGRKVICYFSAGSHENWRPDAGEFPSGAIGEPLDGWPGERWVDVRNPTIRSIMTDRLDLAVAKGCDAVEPDNVDGYTQDDGFSFGRADQVEYLRYLSAAAHARGLSIGLKNATDLVPELVDDFDWALNEECLAYAECATERPFLNAGKAVFHVEYVDDRSEGQAKATQICSAPSRAGFSTLIKTWDLDAWRVTCP